VTAEAQRLAELFDELCGQRESPTRPMPPFGGLAGELVYSFLAWEAGQRRAGRAARRLAAAVVDLNELRVCVPAELRGMFGPRYPMALDRARRLRAALQSVFEQDGTFSLSSLASLSALEAQATLLDIPGVTPFVAARVSLLGLGCPALPIDGRIARALRRCGALPADVRNDDAGQWATESLGDVNLADAYLRLDRWVDSLGDEGGAG
jgi:endonuclease III